MSNVTLRVWSPERRLDRIKGLIGLQTIPYGLGAWFPECRWVHTFFMHCTIDCIGLNANNIVSQIRIGIGPSHFVKFCHNVRSVVELREGSVPLFDIKVGSRIIFIKHISRKELLECCRRSS